MWYMCMCAAVLDLLAEKDAITAEDIRRELEARAADPETKNILVDGHNEALEALATWKAEPLVAKD